MYRRGITGLGVADGVYMWKEQGIDSGRFSKGLMSSALDAMRQGAHDVLTGQPPPHTPPPPPPPPPPGSLC